jgi:hypothetical protein
MSGAEARAADGWLSLGTGVARSDFARPYNPGNVLRFDSTGTFALYDEFLPRQRILLNAGGTTRNAGTLNGTLEYFLNAVETDGRAVTATVDGVAKTVNSDGDDVLFGDLGNDWMVGGTGRDTLWGGWGNDLLNADDDLRSTGGANDVPETHPSYEDRAYGGAGLDVLIGNTGGRPADRLGRRVQLVHRPVLPVRHRDGQPPGHAWPLRVPVRPVTQPGRRPDAPADTGQNGSRNGEPAGEIGWSRRRTTPGRRRRAARATRSRQRSRRHARRPAQRVVRQRAARRLLRRLRQLDRERGSLQVAAARRATTPSPSSTSMTTCRPTTRSPRSSARRSPPGRGVPTPT